MPLCFYREIRSGHNNKSGYAYQGKNMAAATMNGLTAESRGRVEDYLNDQFQNVADLENIDNLLAKVHEQQELLRKQLDSAKKENGEAEEEFEREASALRERAIKHEAEQADIARRLQTLTQSQVSDDAIRKFEEPMQKLRRIEIAEHYAMTLQGAEKLEEQARKYLADRPEEAVSAYQALQHLVQSLEEAQPAAEGAAPHLLDRMVNSSKALFEHIKQDLETRLRKTLETMKWPQEDLQLLGKPFEEWSRYTTQLLALQEPNLLPHNSDVLTQTPQEPSILLPLAVMVQPLAQRFRYHFYGDRPTNRLDKPEYFFRHTLDLLTQHNDFMSEYLQPILDARTQQDDRLELVYTDAISAFITALIPMVSAKCLSILPHLTSQPQLMSHFVRELMLFDTELQHSWAYSPFPGPLSEWKGLTWDMLTKHGYFEPWLKLEQDFAVSRYQKIVDSQESRDIDFDGVEAGRTNPTKGAIRVNDLLETITDRYRNLSSFSQKMKFLIDVQLAIFDRYHLLLSEYFQVYRSSAHTAGRLISGQAAGQALGLEGLGTLLKIFGSAEYLERKMSDWSDDVFFLELWEELQDRASTNTGINGTVGRDLSVEEVASKTSTTIKNADEILESDGGALFDETTTAYRRLRESSEAEIVRLLQINARNAIRPLQNMSVWASLSGTTSDITQMPPSSALDSFNQAMTPLLEFLAKVLAPGPLRRVVKQTCHTVLEEIYDRLLMKNNFSAAGANQLRRDVIAICSTIDRAIGMSGEAQRHFTRLNDALRLLSLPIKASARANTGTDLGDDGWGFDDEDGADNGALDVETSFDEDAWGLWQAEKAIFADNASARKALESMGISELSEGDARSIVKRRIEVNS
ncbi:hypothetical protein PMZ80_009256 [Knufia obscura]|uniref:Uncharacterized protein n=2 Tax=Knufia TaxID=430999 RepID=A0AAN8ENZ3_9EURO|nr:hypothetical protein PMZ80_009256 [Knufia obscura]KAK5949003.1 hypothetical protein OHC33_009924 [Knufia fluminis]